jgi:hypothetical protein
VFLGVIVILATAIHNGLAPRRRKELVEKLDLSAQTLWRWKRWWRTDFVQTRYWQGERGRYSPPIDESALPGSLLGRLRGNGLQERLTRLLWRIAPVTSGSVFVF